MTVVDFITERPYRALIGPGALDRLGEHVRDAALVGILHAPPLASAARRAGDLVRIAGAEPVLIELPDGEAAKTPQVLARCWSAPPHVRLRPVWLLAWLPRRF